MNWEAVKQVNKEFHNWYSRLPTLLRIGDNPFDINYMTLPSNFHEGIYALHLRYYGEWMAIYGNFISATNVLGEEETLLESKKIAFLASQAVVKIAQFMSEVAVCRVEFYWILFACEPLLYLVNASEKYIADESRKCLQSATKSLKKLMCYTDFGAKQGSSIALINRISERISKIFLSYGVQY